MSDSNIPPDDFSATTPNIKLPKKDSPDFSSQPASDWEKTNYNYSPKDLGKEDWNKTAFNLPNPPQPSAKDAEWGMTEANLNLPGNRSNQYDNPVYEDFGERKVDTDKTSAGLKLPGNEEQRYQQPKYEEPQYQAPPRKERAEEQKDGKKKGGIPGWIWAGAGLGAMFLFAAVVLGLVYFLFLGKTGFEVIVKSVPAGSDVLIDGSYWGVTDSDGTIKLLTLRAGQSRKIEIKNSAYKCKVKEIEVDEAKNGAVISRIAECEASGTVKPPDVGNAPKECLDIKPAEIEKSRKCAHDELDKLEKAEKEGKMFNADQVTFAMNLYIILFPVNRFEIVQPKDKEFIARAAGFMKKLPANIVIEVGGHTDADGGDKKNLPLSENRATSVRNSLVENGVNPIMLRTKGYSSSQPRAPNDTPENKFKNRRIQYTVVSQ